MLNSPPISLLLKHLVYSLLLSILAGYSQAQSDFNLPDLGNSSSTYISPEKEREIGQLWLKMFRAQVKTSNDAFIQDYTESLLAKLVKSSELSDPRLDTVIVKNQTLNAFAVPGGIIGVHTGLFLSAKTEEQFASVLTHELAHLSQHHYTRGVDATHQSRALQLKGLLAGLVLAATAGGDAGVVAISASQAASIDQQLRFSRQSEKEADRIGLKTLSKAGMNASAAVDMFEEILKATRYARIPPEFLLTHPVTETRINDASNRARRLPAHQYTDTPNYHLVRARVILSIQENPEKAITYFKQKIDADTSQNLGHQYGLALALLQNKQAQEASKILAPLEAALPSTLMIQLARIDIAQQQNGNKAALKELKKVLELNPNHYPVIMQYAMMLEQDHQYEASREVLAKLAKKRPNDPVVWYQLAEVSGLAGDIQQLHLARAEYYISIGVFDAATKQLNNALKLASKDPHKRALIQQRIRDVRKMKNKAKS